MSKDFQPPNLLIVPDYDVKNQLIGVKIYRTHYPTSLSYDRDSLPATEILPILNYLTAHAEDSKTIQNEWMGTAKVMEKFPEDSSQKTRSEKLAKDLIDQLEKEGIASKIQCKEATQQSFNGAKTSMPDMDEPKKSKEENYHLRGIFDLLKLTHGFLDAVTKTKADWYKQQWEKRKAESKGSSAKDSNIKEEMKVQSEQNSDGNYIIGFDPYRIDKLDSAVTIFAFKRLDNGQIVAECILPKDNEKIEPEILSQLSIVIGKYRNKKVTEKTTALSYSEAHAALDSGKKVKLPEWTGYWFKKNDKVMVLTGDGEILTTPHFEKFKDRNDWLITDGGLGFDWALRAASNGKKVKRATWLYAVSFWITDGILWTDAGNDGVYKFFPDQAMMQARDWQLRDGHPS